MRVERGQGRRSLEAVGFVAVWIALGFALRLAPLAYLLLGVPLTLSFQRFIARRPIRSLWVRAAPTLSFDRTTLALTAALLVVPLAGSLQAVRDHHWRSLPLMTAALAGAVPLAYALRLMRGRETRAALACLATSGLIGTLVFALHAVIASGADGAGRQWQTLIFAHQLLLLLPLSFVVEEVSFRGAIDAHVQQAAEGRGLLSALFVSALWGLWHLPVVGPLPGAAPWLSRCAGLIVFHTMVGVPLSIFWRRSGNLLVPAFSHAFADAVRDAFGS